MTSSIKFYEVHFLKHNQLYVYNELKFGNFYGGAVAQMVHWGSNSIATVDNFFFEKYINYIKPKMMEIYGG